MAAHRGERADVLLVDPAFAGAAVVLGYPRAERPAVVVCGVLPLSLASRDTAPYGMAIAPMAGGLGRLRNSALASLAGRVLAPAERRADEMYREVHGVDMPGAVLDWSRRADAIAQFTVAEFEYPRSDAPDTCTSSARSRRRVRRRRGPTGGATRRFEAGRARDPGHVREQGLRPARRADARGARR